MKKVLLLLLFLDFVLTLSAQTRNVTTFLGIPVDGTQTSMVQKLKAKGFRYDSARKCLTGEFNGLPSDIMVVTNRNKVWRIMVADRNPMSETDIKIRFNNLCTQFAANDKKYSFPNFEYKDYTIPDDESILMETTLHNKRYEAVFWQGSLKDTACIKKDAYDEAMQIWRDNYGSLTKEQIDSISYEDAKKQYSDALVKLFGILAEKYSMRPVWFMISKDDYDVLRPYRILMYYDNEYNHSNGEDL